MADRRTFVDTNILVYANWSGAERHEDARLQLMTLGSAGTETCVSRQVLREFLAVVTRPQGAVVPMSVDEAVETVRDLGSLFLILEDSEGVAQTLLGLVRQFEVKGRVIHDANIVATMLDAGVTRLLTANPCDFRRFADIIDIEPL